MKTSLRYGFFAAALSVAAFAADPAVSTPSATPAPADPAASPGWAARTHARAAVLAHQLDLTEAQQAQLKAVRQQTAATIKGIRANSSLTPDQQRAQIAAQRQSARDQFKALLTPDQQAKLATLEAHPGKLHAMVDLRLRLTRLAKTLGLSDAQKSQLKQIRQSARASIQPIRENASLTADQKRAQIQPLLQSARAQMRAVLTPEQQQKFDEMRDRALDRALHLG